MLSVHLRRESGYDVAANCDAFVQLMNRYHKPLLYYLRRFMPARSWKKLRWILWAGSTLKNRLRRRWRCLQ
jgi:hypothetical protein